MLLLISVWAAPAYADSPQQKIIVGGDYNYPPYESLDKNGQPVGFHIDLMRAIAEVMGFKVAFQLGPWDEVRKALYEGQIDVLFMFYSQERDRILDFSTPHTIVHHEFFIRRNSPPIHSLDELHGKQVIVQRDSFIHEYLSQHDPDAPLIPVDSELEALRLLASGEHDVAVVSQIGVQNIIRRYSLSNLTSTGPPFLPREYSLAVLEGRSDLLEKLNRGLAIVKATGRYTEIYDKWLGPLQSNGLSAEEIARYTAWILIPLLALISGIWIWTASLRRQVTLRTNDLQAELAERKRTERELLQLNRTLQVLNACDESLVRATHEEQLLQQICDILVDVGQYPFVWIGFIERRKEQWLRPITWAGQRPHSNCLSSAGISGNAPLSSISSNDQAVRIDHPCITCNTLAIPGSKIQHWMNLERGYSAALVLPLKDEHGVFGALNLYTTQSDAFDDNEVKLLTQLTNDLAYGIISLRTRVERTSYESQLKHQVNHDALTQLPNRKLLWDRLDLAITCAAQSSQIVAVLFIDLDRFKPVNDSLGHIVGDTLLQAVAARLKLCVRKNDMVARLGGDEFVILLENLEQERLAAAVARKVLKAMQSPFIVEGQEFFVTCSIGISLFPKDGQDTTSLLRNADIAMYRAKAAGRNNFQLYTREMNARASERLILENSLRRALERRELLLHYQPQVDLSSDNIIGVEALLRWQHPELGMVSPAEFIPLAEETGLIIPISEWVLRTACAQAQQWQEEGLPALGMAVNLSSRQFLQLDLSDLVARILQETGLTANWLKLEITESLLMQDVEGAIAAMQKLKAMGIRLSIDDFGTGYSSLNYLKRFPIDQLKIDRSFVRDITTDPDDAAIALAVIALAHSLRLKVIAEGVETEEQLTFLRAKGCDEIQGYYFSAPRAPQEISVLLQSNRRLKLEADKERTRQHILLLDQVKAKSSLLH